MADSDTKLLLNPDEAAKLLSIKPNQLLKLARRGEVPCVKLGRLVKFPLARLVREVVEAK